MLNLSSRHILTILATLCLTSFVLADTETLDGITWTYTLTDGKASITKCSPSSGNLVIPDTLGEAPVTEIGSNAFKSCTSLQSIAIPNSVTAIGAGAFRNCTSLRSVTLPSHVTTIGTLAFGYCSRLTSITIPASVTRIEQQAFAGCGIGSVTALGDLPKGSGVRNLLEQVDETNLYWAYRKNWRTAMPEGKEATFLDAPLPKDTQSAFETPITSQLSDLGVENDLDTDFEVYVKTTNGEAQHDNAKASAVLECFTGITATADTDANTLTFTCDFGIDKMTIRKESDGVQLYVRVKVQGENGAPADFAEGTKLIFLQGGTAIDASNITEAIPSGADQPTGTKWHRIPLAIFQTGAGNTLTVKASHEPPTT